MELISRMPSGGFRFSGGEDLRLDKEMRDISTISIITSLADETRVPKVDRFLYHGRGTWLLRPSDCGMETVPEVWKWRNRKV